MSRLRFTIMTATALVALAAFTLTSLAQQPPAGNAAQQPGGGGRGGDVAAAEVGPGPALGSAAPAALVFGGPGGGGLLAVGLKRGCPDRAQAEGQAEGPDQESERQGHPARSRAPQGDGHSTLDRPAAMAAATGRAALAVAKVAPIGRAVRRPERRSERRWRVTPAARTVVASAGTAAAAERWRRPERWRRTRQPRQFRAADGPGSRSADAALPRGHGPSSASPASSSSARSSTSAR